MPEYVDGFFKAVVEELTKRGVEDIDYSSSWLPNIAFVRDDYYFAIGDADQTVGMDVLRGDSGESVESYDSGIFPDDIEKVGDVCDWILSTSGRHGAL